MPAGAQKVRTMSGEGPSAVGFPMFDDFDPHKIEARWQRVWEAERTWEVTNDASGRDRAYVLEQLPYTSGEPHVGHLKNYTVGDAVAHYWRRQGRYVLHPMGYDAFGLPAENHAIRTGRHPQATTDESIASFRAQFKRWGLSIDWSREISSHDPAYYRWTQWIFLQLYDAGLAYRGSVGGQLVPGRRDSPGQRAGGRRLLRAMRRPGADAPDGAVVLPDHRVCRPAAGRARRAAMARPCHDHAAELDRPLRGRLHRLRHRSGSCSGYSPPAPTPCSAPRTWCWRRSIRWWTR